MFHNKGLSASLASRLSRGESNFNKTDIKQADTFPSNNGLHGRLGRPISSLRRKSVYSRLTGTSNKRILQIQSNAFLKSIKAIGSEVNKSRRPINGLKTKSNSDEFLPVRINNGALVKGLRSDQLLLQRVKEQKSLAFEHKRERNKMLREREKPPPEKVNTLMRSSRVSMDLNTGLTISFANNDVVKKNRLSLKGKPSYSGQSDEMSVNSSEDEYPVKKHQRPSFRNDLAEEVKVPLLRIGMERPPPPKPHQQILDTKVQKEIAALQGRLESPHSGPGPGVKNFRMIPNLTKFSLSERFTIERTVIE